MKIDKIPPMFNNLHGNVHNEIGPAQRAGKDKFVKNKKNYCNEKGECTDIKTQDECKYCEDCTCSHACEMCKHLSFKECTNDKARKEAGVND